jgi:hypothetical protein
MRQMQVVGYCGGAREQASCACLCHVLQNHQRGQLMLYSRRV